QRICVMQKGRVLQIGAPRSIYEDPETSFVAGFLGSPRMNLLDAEVEGDVLTCGPFRLPKPPGAPPRALVVGVRPEAIAVGEAADATRGGDGGDVAGSDGATATLAVAIAEPLGADTH